MRVIEQLVEYLYSRDLLTKADVQQICEQGLLRPHWLHDGYEYDSHLDSEDPEAYCDEIYYEEVYAPQERLELNAQSDQRARARSSKGARRQRRSRASHRAYRGLRSEFDKLLAVHPEVQSPLIMLAKRIDPAVADWSAAITPLLECDDGRLRSAFGESLRAGEVPVESLRDLLTFDIYRPLRQTLPVSLRSNCRAVLNAGNVTQPETPKARTLRLPLPELLVGFVSLQRRIGRLLRERLLQCPADVLGTPPRRFAEHHLMGLLLACVWQSTQNNAAGTANVGVSEETRSVNATHTHSAMRLVLCCRTPRLDKDENWQQWWQAAWHLAGMLFPESFVAVLHSWSSSGQLSLFREQVHPTVRSLADRLHAGSFLLIEDEDRCLDLQWHDEVQSLLNDPRRLGAMALNQQISIDLALPIMTANLKNPSEAIRLNAMESLNLAGRAALPAIPALKDLLNDTNEQVRSQAAATIGRIEKAVMEYVQSAPTVTRG